MVSSRRFSLLLLDNLSQEYLGIFSTLFSRKEQRLWSFEEYHNAPCKFLSGSPLYFFFQGFTCTVKEFFVVLALLQRKPYTFGHAFLELRSMDLVIITRTISIHFINKIFYL